MIHGGLKALCPETSYGEHQSWRYATVVGRASMGDEYLQRASTSYVWAVGSLSSPLWLAVGIECFKLPATWWEGGGQGRGP